MILFRTSAERGNNRETPAADASFDFRYQLASLPNSAGSLAVLATLLAVVPTVQAQTLQVLHNFTGGSEETSPWGGLTIDRSGHLYGTTIGPLGCTAGCGTVYRFSREGSGWILSTLYAFRGGQDGTIPYAPVTVAADGSLYGTTIAGGLLDGCIGNGCGTVFHLQPPASFCHSVSCPWNETVVHRFQNCSTLYSPQDGVALDQAGNVFGAPTYGGIPCQDDNFGDGGVFELTPSQGGGATRLSTCFLGITTD